MAKVKGTLQQAASRESSFSSNSDYKSQGPIPKRRQLAGSPSSIIGMDRHRSKVDLLEQRRQEVLRAKRILDQRAKMREESSVAFQGMRAKRRSAEAAKYQAESLDAKARNKALLTQMQDETQQLHSNLTAEGLPLVPSTVSEQLKAERDRYFQALVVATVSWRSESTARLASQQAQLSALSLQAVDAEKKAKEAEALFQEEKAVALAAHVRLY